METELFEGDELTFTDKFTEGLPGMLGLEKLEHEDGKPIKMFENTPNLKSLVKMAFDTKTAQGKKMDNVIQKPADDASDEVKAEYMTALDTARGVPQEAQNYEFPLGDGETEEKFYTEEDIKAYKEYAKEAGVPGEVFKGFVALNRKLAGTQTQKITDALQAKEDEAITKTKERHKGDKLVEAGKMVFNALTKFNKNNPEFIAKIKEQKCFENPTDFQRWKNAGVTIFNWDAWYEIATELKISHSVDGEQGVKSGGTLEGMFPKSSQTLKG